MADTIETYRRGSVTLEVPYPSKVVLPVRRPPIIRRQRLLELLAQGLERRVIIVSAPAGYGKTSLILDFARSCDIPVCWYSLDEREPNLETFLRYLLASGQAQFPGFGGELAQALQQGEPISPEEASNLLVTAVQTVGEPFAIILDDVHHLDSAPPELRQALEGWIYRMPENCHLILAARTRPQLTVLPLMSARQEVATIASSEFSFTCDEVVRLFQEVLDKEVSLDDGQHLADVTEGWAAALILLADKVRLAHTSISPEQLRGSDTLAMYIKVEQFDPLPPEVRDFLLASAVPRTIEVQFTNELLDIADAEEMINFLDQRNLFIVREDEEQTRYRYNKLVRAFLVSHLRTQDPQRFRELNLKAAGLREQAEEWEEAVYHYLQASAWERIVQVAERVGWRLFREGKWDTLADWLEAIPPEELSAQPKLLLWKARMLHHLHQLDRALSLLAEAIVSFEAKKEWNSLAEALVTKGMCLRVKGDYKDSEDVLARARSLLLQHDGPTSILTEARKELGITYGMCGEFDKELHELKGALEAYDAQGDSYNIAHVNDQIGVALVALGQLSEAAGYLMRARQRWSKLGNDKRLVQNLNNLGMLHYLQGDFDQADALFRQALGKVEEEIRPEAEAYLLTCLGDIRRDRGKLQAALELYNSALERGANLDEAYIRIYIMDAIANTYRLMGDIGDGESWAKRAAAEAEERGGVFELGLCTLTRGLIQRDRGQPKEAVSSVEETTRLFKQADAKRELATAHFHLAGVYFSLKRKRLALESLEIVAKLVQELGYDHFLKVEAARNPLLVQYAAANKIADGYFGQMLKVMKASSGAAAEASQEGAQPESTGTTIQAYGLGNLRVEIDGREITDLEWRSEKSKEMFFFFLCNRRPLRKEEIVAALWPDLPDEKTGSAFHSNLYRLRQALYPDCIAKDSGRYILDPQGYFPFDVADFQQALQAAGGLPKDSPEALALQEKALESYKGSFASDFYSEWAETLRWQMEEQYMRLLATLAAAHSQAGEFKRSADLCQRILDVDELNEAAWYRLMSNYIQSGHPEAAKYSYNRYAQIVSDNLAGETPPDFDEIQREISRGRSLA